jgi:hypothetical protein
MRNRCDATPRREVLLSAAIGICLIFAVGCNSPSPANVNSDTTEHRANAKNEPVKSISVTPPNSPVPKQAADSIWNGDYVEKYANGVVKKRGYVQAGLASGEWLTFYEDGKQYSRGYYHNGIRTGYGVSWYHDGQMSSEGYYNNGKAVGKWKYWSETDHQVMEKNYGGEMPDTTAQGKMKSIW